MTSVIRYTRRVISGTKHPRIWVPPTQFKNRAKISKSNFQGIGVKLLYLWNQRYSVNQFPVFEIEKSPIQKKNYADFLSRNST